MDPTVYLFQTEVKNFFLSVDCGSDDPGVHGGDHLQQAGQAQEARVHLDVQQERCRLPERRHQLSPVQVKHLPWLMIVICFVCLLLNEALSYYHLFPMEEKMFSSLVLRLFHL